jgi:hypothetical protein
MEEKVVKGKVVHQEGKYFLEVAGKKEELPVGLFTDEGFLKDQVGQEVEVFYSTPRPFVVAIKPVRLPGIITCNMIAEILRGEAIMTHPTAEMALHAATKLLKGGFITQKAFDIIQRGKG